MAMCPTDPDTTRSSSRATDGRPHRISVLLPARVIPLDLVIPLQVFGQWADYVYDVAGVSRHPYQVTVAGRPGADVGGLLSAREVCALSTLEQADTVVVPGIGRPSGDLEPEVVDALRAAHARGARLVSICTGAFLLAAAGVLDGRQATTHWAWADDLQRRHPTVRVLPGQLYLDHGDVVTSAGILAGVDVCLHLLRRDQGQVLANTVARYLVSAPHRQGGQAQFIQTPVSPEVEDLGPVLRWVLDHLGEPLTLEAIAQQANLSSRSLSRRFKATTGSSTMDWVTAQRVTRARELLETTDATITDIAHSCGFGSTESLRTHFAAHTHTSPSRYRQAFQ